LDCSPRFLIEDLLRQLLKLCSELLTRLCQELQALFRCPRGAFSQGSLTLKLDLEVTEQSLRSIQALFTLSECLIHPLVVAFVLINSRLEGGPFGNEISAFLAPARL
jgi:hypothetical protein